MSVGFELANRIANQVIDECDSTNDLAKRLAESGFPHGTWVSARMQKHGRGRLGRAWQSGEGNLFFSMVARFQARELWTWIPLAAAVAVVRAVPEVEIRIKWPNDLWIESGKVGGILCEGSIQGAQAYQIIGIGVNCASLPPLVTDQPVRSLSQASGRRITADDLREPLRMRLLEVLEALEKEGPEAIRQAYEERAVFQPGSQVEWASGKGRGTVLRLGDAGELRVQNTDGAEISLFAEDVQVRPS